MRLVGSVLCLLAAVALPAGGAETKQPKERKPAREPKQQKTPKPKPEPLGESLCPATISVEQRVSGAPDGWEAAQSDAKPQLAMVTFFDGPPAERASLKYDREEREKRDWTAVWTLAPNARGYWIQCAYDHTTAVLSRRLPAEVTGCRVSYERKTQTAAGLPAVRHVACK